MLSRLARGGGGMRRFAYTRKFNRNYNTKISKNVSSNENEPDPMTASRVVSAAFAMVVGAYWAADKSEIGESGGLLPCYIASGMIVGGMAGLVFPYVTTPCIVLYPVYREWQKSQKFRN